MCGRYLFSATGTDRASQRLQQLWAMQFPDVIMPHGDIFPGMSAPILVAGNGKLQLLQAKWGYDTGTGVLVNARWETAAQKPMFRHNNRCVIPTSGFYEWSASKEKYLFCGQEPVLYLAGLYRKAVDGMEFVILTQPAGRKVRGIHHRMPVLLPMDALLPWVRDGQSSLHDLPHVTLQDGIITSE